jgi:hypothetical protein
MGVEYNHLGEVCESRKQDKERKICMGSYSSFRQSSFYMNNKEREERKILELEQSWRVNYGAY